LQFVGLSFAIGLLLGYYWVIARLLAAYGRFIIDLLLDYGRFVGRL
jgi:hypothetical protein